MDDFGALVLGKFCRLKSLGELLTTGGPPRVNVTRSVHGGTRCEWIIEVCAWKIRVAHPQNLRIE